MKCFGQNRPRQLLLALLAMGQMLGTAHAATNGLAPFSIRIWQTDDGLPQNSVHAITQTADGYLWVGTHEGLARFDGVRFRLMEEADAPELRHGYVTALCAGRDGSLWVACDNVGVFRLKEGSFSRLSETNGLPGTQVRCLFESRDGSIWIGGENGLTQFKDGQLKNFTDRNGLGDLSVRAIHEDGQGRLRVATRRGLSTLLPDGNFSSVNLAANMTANALKSVWVDKAERIWTGSNEGLYLIDGEKRSFFSGSEGLPDKITTILFGDREGRIWVGTYSGLAQFVEGKMIPLPVGEGASGDRIQAMFQDNEGNLWVGSWDGLYRLTPARFSTYTTEQGLTWNNVMSVCEGRDGELWFGTWGGGLNRLHEGKITAFTTANGLPHDQVLSVYEADDGNLWVGMEERNRVGGLNRLRLSDAEKNSRGQFSKQGGLTTDAVRVIHKDRQGNLWAGTSRGVKMIRDGKVSGFLTDQGLAGNLVLAICERSTGEIWLGTDGGLSRWDGNGKFTNFTTNNGLSHDAINAIYEDAGKALWVGTKAGGLNRFANGKFTAYTTQQGLFSDEIYEIVEDDFGFFWMSCRKGIFRVSRKEFDDLDAGKVKELSCVSFGKADGLVSVQCNGVAKPAGWKGRDGRIWFPTIRGVVAADTKIKTNEKPPPVVIEEITDGQRILRHDGLAGTNTAALTIPPGRGEIVIHFTALSLQTPEKNRFEYWLEGVDPTWKEANGIRTARYNNVKHGRYRFHVKASNNDGVWNSHGATLALVFQPHYWETWWFKAGIGVGVGMILFALYRARMKRLQEIENLRVQIAADLHDDVGSRLTKVAMVTESVDAETPATDRNKPHIHSISTTTREIIQAMDEIVWTINPKNDTLDHLANYIFQYAQDYFQDSGVRCRMDLPARLPELPVSTQERHNLFMAVKEALNNILKHAQASEVRISLVVSDSKLTLTISDNGRGFETENPGPFRNGLQNMRQRMEKIGGRLTLESKPASGTTIKMEANGK